MKTLLKSSFLLNLLGFFAVAILLSSCASMSSMQTGRTIGEGEIGYGVGVGYVNSNLGDETDTLNIKAPFLETYAKYGITDKLDVGAKVTVIGTYGVDAKYQFLGDQDSPLAGSIGLGGGLLNIESGGIENNIFDLTVPAYFSYHPNDWLGIYASPRYTFRNNRVTNADGVKKDSFKSHWYGVTGGMRIGKKTAFLLEYSYFGNNQNSSPLSQITGGIAIGIN